MNARLIFQSLACTFLAAALLLLAAVPGAGAVRAQSGTPTVAILPEFSSVVVGTPVQLQLVVRDGVNVNGYDITITYDAARLSLASWSHGGYLSNLWTAQKTDLPGTFRLAVVQLAAAPVSGDGVLLNFVFNTLAAGESDVTIAQAIFADLQGAETSPIRLDGGVAAAAEPSATPTMTSTVTATATATQTATLTMTMTQTQTQTATPTLTATPTWTPTPTRTRSSTATVPPTTASTATARNTLAPTAVSALPMSATPTSTAITTQAATLTPDSAAQSTQTERVSVEGVSMELAPGEPGPTLTPTEEPILPGGIEAVQDEPVEQNSPPTQILQDLSFLVGVMLVGLFVFFGLWKRR